MPVRNVIALKTEDLSLKTRYESWSWDLGQRLTEEEYLLLRREDLT